MFIEISKELAEKIFKALRDNLDATDEFLIAMSNKKEWHKYPEEKPEPDKEYLVLSEQGKFYIGQSLYVLPDRVVFITHCAETIPSVQWIDLPEIPEKQG